MSVPLHLEILKCRALLGRAFSPSRLGKGRKSFWLCCICGIGVKDVFVSQSEKNAEEILFGLILFNFTIKNIWLAIWCFLQSNISQLTVIYLPWDFHDLCMCFFFFFSFSPRTCGPPGALLGVSRAPSCPWDVLVPNGVGVLLGFCLHPQNQRQAACLLLLRPWRNHIWGKLPLYIPAYASLQREIRLQLRAMH